MKNSFRPMRPVVAGVEVRDDFWSPKLQTFRAVTLPDALNKLEKDGAVDNFRKVAKGEGEHQACPWHDGLLFETLRGASDYLRLGRDAQLEARIDAYVDVVAEAQQAAGGGYLSTYTLLDRPNQRYGENGGNIQWQHDLYNCGCLFEAGVHYYASTGKAKLLECALRCANDLADTIGPAPKKWIVPAHSLPEYALLELYDLAKREPDLAQKVNVPVRTAEYLRLADFWVRGRGQHEQRTNNPQYLGEYAQDHAPIHQQFQAVGHAVRATLYYAGVTRLAIEQQDAELLGDSNRLWENAIGRKFHINGGVGATHFEEKFGIDYELPNDAYLETCATVGLIYWAKALHDATGDAAYYHIIERALYNIMLSSVTLQGDAYFYRNPLMSKGDDHHWAWHGCPCCPPMIHKLFGAFDTYLYSASGDTCYVNLYVSSQAKVALDGGALVLRQAGEYPWKGEIHLTVEQAGPGAKLALRIPDWTSSYQIFRGGAAVPAEVADGYAVLSDVKVGEEIRLSLPIRPMRMQAHPYVRPDRGHVALQRGPLVYCLEGVDNKGIVDVELPEDLRLSETWRPELLGGVMTMEGQDTAGESFQAVPLYSWDNRMAGPMQVWLRQKGMSDTWDATDWESLYRPYRP